MGAYFIGKSLFWWANMQGSGRVYPKELIAQVKNKHYKSGKS